MKRRSGFRRFRRFVRSVGLGLALGVSIVMASAWIAVACAHADTSAFSSRGVLFAKELRPADVVVGPDPYTARNWYANVKNGKVV